VAPRITSFTPAHGGDGASVASASNGGDTGLSGHCKRILSGCSCEQASTTIPHCSVTSSIGIAIDKF
jgi:hypothetical protein